MKVVPPIVIAAAVATAAASLAACSVLRNPDSDAQAIVNRKLTGMKVGDFIDRYGGSRMREENADGSVSFLWQSRLRAVAPGILNPDDNLCRVRITADRGGRIIVSQIASDTIGDQSTSECADVFR